jgi:cellulose synthase/poly-beta-1,6-N-acetylglucosamine synthase-like glycosyltransferase
MTGIGPAVCLTLLAPATLAVAVPATLAAVGRLSRRRTTSQVPQLLPSVVVLIPAHDEAAALPTALRSLAAQDYPADRMRVVVVADNCADDTAAVAAAHLATVVTRADAARPGKGYALAAGLDALAGDPFDVVLVLDADCTLNRAALRELVGTLEVGVDVAQAAVRSRNADDGPAGFAAAVGAATDAAVAVGRDRLGLSARLRGTGMAFRRSALGRVRWATGSPVEDAEYDRQLRAAGVRVGYAAGAEATASAPALLTDLCRQRRRWAAAGPLGSKPLGLVLVGLAAAACGTLGHFLSWALTLVLVAGAFYFLVASEVGWSRRRVGLLLAAPAVVTRLAAVAVAGWLRPVRGWVPAPG